MPTEAEPFNTSATNTTRPYFQPSRRTTLDGPGLPEPSAVTSTPPRFATMSALGMVPKKYETIIAPAT